MLELRRSTDRGITDLGWLYSHHTFSFGHYYDPRHMGFSDLRVINDDRVQPGMGFGTHGHKDMEIFSYVLKGALEHKDSTGSGSVIRGGDVQMMSAGTGILHSEFNHSESELVHFLQIWIVPDKKRVPPRYQQSHFSEAEKRGRLRLIVSPDGELGSLPIYQDTKVFSGLFDHGESATLHLGQNRYAYAHVTRGSIDINGARLEEGDGARIHDEIELRLSSGRNAEVLVFSLRPRERSDM